MSTDGTDGEVEGQTGCQSVERLSDQSSVLVRVSVSVKRHHDHTNSYKGKLVEVAYSSEVQFIIIMVEHDSVQADMMLERELRVLHLDFQAVEASTLSIV